MFNEVKTHILSCDNLFTAEVLRLLRMWVVASAATRLTRSTSIALSVDLKLRRSQATSQTSYLS